MEREPDEPRSQGKRVVVFVRQPGVGAGQEQCSGYNPEDPQRGGVHEVHPGLNPWSWNKAPASTWAHR